MIDKNCLFNFRIKKHRETCNNTHPTQTHVYFDDRYLSTRCNKNLSKHLVERLAAKQWFSNVLREMVWLVKIMCICVCKHHQQFPMLNFINRFVWCFSLNSSHTRNKKLQQTLNTHNKSANAARAFATTPNYQSIS